MLYIILFSLLTLSLGMNVYWIFTLIKSRVFFNKGRTGRPLTENRFNDSWNLLSSHLVKFHKDRDENSLWCRFAEISRECQDVMERRTSTYTVNNNMYIMYQERIEFLNATIKELRKEEDLK